MKDVKDAKTTVALSPETKKQLADFGNKGESFDTIIRRVMSKTDSLCNQSQNDDVVEEEP